MMYLQIFPHVPCRYVRHPIPTHAPFTHFGDLILVAVAHFPYQLTSSVLLTGYLRFVQHDT